MELDHQALLKDARAGKAKARRALYEYHERYWFRLCLRYAGNKNEAEDIFQESVVKLFEVLHKYDLRSNSFNAWSNRVIINAAIKYMKRHHWRHSFEDLDKIEAIPYISESALDKLSSKELIGVIQRLPSGYRTVFNLFEIEGYSHLEIAEMMDISVGTSKSQLSKAKKLLRKQLEVLLK